MTTVQFTIGGLSTATGSTIQKHVKPTSGANAHTSNVAGKWIDDGCPNVTEVGRHVILSKMCFSYIQNVIAIFPFLPL